MSYSIDLKSVFSTKGRVALVTGGTTGIGFGIARVLAVAGGATVYVLGRRPASEFEAEIMAVAEEGGAIIPVQADVTKSVEIDAAFREIEERFGGVDILINNAGTTLAKDVTDTTEEEWQWILDTNLTSGFLCSKRAFPHMQSRRWGRIVQISSVVGHQGAVRGHVAYATTKSGQYGITKTLARTGAPFGITVNAVAPGLVRTPLIVQAHGDEGVEELRKNIPLGISEPEDIGTACLFLCSEAARHVTGATIDVNGGFYMH